MFLRTHGLVGRMQEYRLFLDWEEIVGGPLARETRPERIEKGTLWIGVSNAPQANHLLYLQPMILRRIRERYPETTIRDMRILHRPSNERWNAR